MTIDDDQQQTVDELSAAISAALDDNDEIFRSPDSVTSSFTSIDVMEEAKHLLQDSTNNNEEGASIGIEKVATTTDTTTSATSVLDNAKKNSGTDNLDAFVISDDDNDEDNEDVVPLKQFENALALIQDLENRVQILETDRQCLAEENQRLQRVTVEQAEICAALEERLASFPKLLEETVQEESQVAAANAENQTKYKFWMKEADRQRREMEEETMKRTRRNADTTQSLKQSDFLIEAALRNNKDKEVSGSSILSKISPATTFARLPGWVSGNNNNISDNKNSINKKMNEKVLSLMT